MTARFNYDRISSLYAQHDVTPQPAEVQGILVGLVATGTQPDSPDLDGLLSDLIYEGQQLPAELAKLLKQQATEIQHALADRDLGFQLLLPEDNAPLQERLNALAGWVQSFLVGFGVNQANIAATSGDLREALDDMIEIAKLEFEVDDSEESERAYFEIVEYLRVSAMMCFTELGARELAQSKPDSKTLH